MKGNGGSLFCNTVIVLVVAAFAFCISTTYANAQAVVTEQAPPPEAVGVNPIYIPQSFFLEHPYSITGGKINFEYVDLDDSGSLIMSEVRADYNIYQNLLGIYAKFHFANANDFGGEDDFDFGNIAVGGKVGLINRDSLILTGGMEVILPTASDGVGAQAAQAYVRDFTYYTDDVFTLRPYLVLGLTGGIFAFQANVDAEVLTSASELEGDSTEVILKYGATASVTPNLPLPFTTSFLVEVLLVSSLTFEDDTTEAFLTPGVRLGGQMVSLGAGVQLPLGENVDDFASADFLVDLVVRFGS